MNKQITFILLVAITALAQTTPKPLTDTQKLAITKLQVRVMDDNATIQAAPKAMQDMQEAQKQFANLEKEYCGPDGKLSADKTGDWSCALPNPPAKPTK